MIVPSRNFEYVNKVSDFKLRTPFMIECFATWCGPCRQQAPHMAQLTKKYGNQFYILSVS